LLVLLLRVVVLLVLLLLVLLRSLPLRVWKLSPALSLRCVQRGQ
jgi:hypothetical protein